MTLTISRNILFKNVLIIYYLKNIVFHMRNPSIIILIMLKFYFKSKVLENRQFE